MTTIVICNLGSRDINHLDQPWDRFPPPARETGQRYWEQRGTAADRLDFPILRPAIDKVLQTTDVIDEIVFIGTDQKNRSHSKGDTLYYARLADAVLAARYGDKIKQSRPLLIGSDPEVNPALYDEAFRVFNDIVHPLAQPDVTHCYLVISGGIPACNTALLFQGLRYFGDRCQLIYMAEGNAMPWTLGVGQQVLEMMHENTVKQLLDRFDFAAAHSLLASEKAAKPFLLSLLAFANARLGFDFAGAQQQLEAAMRHSTGTARQTVQAMQTDLHTLMQGDEKALIGELYFNALIAWENGRFVDFLGRATRFQAAVLTHMIAHYPETYHEPFPMPVDAEKLATQPGLRQAALALLTAKAATTPTAPQTTLQAVRQRLIGAFSISELDGLCFNFGFSPEMLAGSTRPDKARELIDYMLRRGWLSELIQAINSARPNLPPIVPTPAGQQQTITAVLQRLEQLTTLRQQSIIGYGFAGVSAAIINQAYSADQGAAETSALSAVEVAASPLQDMFDVCTALNIPATSPIITIRNFILTHLN